MPAGLTSDFTLTGLKLTGSKNFFLKRYQCNSLSNCFLWYGSPNHWAQWILFIHSWARHANLSLRCLRRGRPSASILSLNSLLPPKPVGFAEDRTLSQRLGNSRSKCVPNQLYIHLLWGLRGVGEKEQRQGSERCSWTHCSVCVF